VSVWEDLDYVDEETNAHRRAVSGSHCHPCGSEMLEEIAALIRGVSALSMTPGVGIWHFTCRREPYGRARTPIDLDEIVVDGKVWAIEKGPLLQLWRLCGHGQVLDVFIPAA
jgi:hypothetical protein